MAKRKHYDVDDLPWQQRNGIEVAVLVLRNGQSAYNPVCPTCKLWGPGKVTYTRWPDGGIDAVEEDLVAA